MRNIAKLLALLILCSISACAQSVAVSLGGIFPSSFQQSSGATGLFPNNPQQTSTAPAQASFDKATLVAVDVGMGILPIFGGEVHYSHSGPGLALQRADSSASTASIDLSTQTVTFDALLHSPAISGFRIYGLAGVGFSCLSVKVNAQTGLPFPTGAPGSLFLPVFAYGGGIEKSLLPLVHVKVEVRDEVASIPSQLYAPGGSWHRAQAEVGVVIGR